MEGKDSLGGNENATIINDPFSARLLYTLFLFFITVLNTVFNTATPHKEMEAAGFVYKHRLRRADPFS